MKKTLLLLSCTFTFIQVNGQKAEMEATIKAFKDKNYTVAIEKAQKAQEKLKDNNLISPEDKVEFYDAATRSAKLGGQTLLSAKFYSLLSDIERKPFYKAKNRDTGDWEYFATKAKAEEVTQKGDYRRIREEDISPKYSNALNIEMTNLLNSTLKVASEAINNKNYSLSGDKYMEAYYLKKALGGDSKLIKYFSGVSYLQIDKKEQAAEILQELLDKGFTGVQTQFLANEKKSGETISFSSKKDMDLQMKSGLFTNPRVNKTESMEEDLYSNLTYAYYNLKEWEKGLKVADAGLKKFPKNKNMSSLISSMYYNSGKSEKFIENLIEKVNSGNASAIDYFNLAKSIEDMKGNNDDVRKYYKKSIELDPNFDNAYINLAFNIISAEKEFVEKMNANLGTSSKEKKIYKENSDKRKALYQEALPFIEKAYQLRPEDEVLIKILTNTYEVIEDDDKYFEMRKKLDKIRK